MPASFLQRFGGCNQPVMQLNLVMHLAESLETPYLRHQELSNYHNDQQERRAVRFLEQQLGLAPESPQMSPSNESGFSSQAITFSVGSDEVVVKHEPPAFEQQEVGEGGVHRRQYRGSGGLRGLDPEPAPVLVRPGRMQHDVQESANNEDAPQNVLPFHNRLPCHHASPPRSLALPYASCSPSHSYDKAQPYALSAHTARNPRSACA
jgi:hypothetical protein